MRNRWGQMPITSISAETLESFLDDHCLQSNCGPAVDVQHHGLEITFDYSFLAPPGEDLPRDIRPQQQPDEENASLNNLSGSGRDSSCPLPETESLWHIGQSKQHRHLLKHPVITSFLWCKWTRIRRYFNRNLRYHH